MTTCLSTGVAFCGIFALACAEIKILSDQSFWTKKMTYIYTFRVFGFFFLETFFYLSFCSFSYVFAAVIDLLLVMLPIQKLQRKHHWDRQFLLPWSSQLCAYISGCIKPITLIWVSLERFYAPADVGYRWYQFWSQVNGQLQAAQESMGPILKTPFGLSFMCFQGADKFYMYFFRTGWILQRYKIYHFWLIQPWIKCKCKCLQVPDKLQNN